MAYTLAYILEILEQRLGKDNKAFPMEKAERFQTLPFVHCTECELPLIRVAGPKELDPQHILCPRCRWIIQSYVGVKVKQA